MKGWLSGRVDLRAPLLDQCPPFVPRVEKLRQHQGGLEPAARRL